MSASGSPLRRWPALQRSCRWDHLAVRPAGDWFVSEMHTIDREPAGDRAAQRELEDPTGVVGPRDLPADLWAVTSRPY
jgi:hypothetical protein